jgi:phytoene dehydrogenase-like protein
MVGQDQGMPVPVGGAATIAEALAALVREAGGRIVTGSAVTRVAIERGRAAGVVTTDGERLRARRAVVADVGAVALARDLVGEEHLPRTFVAEIARFRHGSGVFKLDLALDGPAPWRLDGLERCGVVHLTGDLETMARSAFEVRRGLLPARPLLVVGQQSVADPTRAPVGCHTLWVEMQAPTRPRGDAGGQIAGGSWDAARQPFAERVLDLLDAHAPGLRERVVGLAVRAPTDIAAENPNLVGGDVNAGTSALDHQGPFRPAAGWARHAMPLRGLYLCSAATHPGGGVHGMGGWNCARRVLRDARRLRPG